MFPTEVYPKEQTIARLQNRLRKAQTLCSSPDWRGSHLIPSSGECSPGFQDDHKLSSSGDWWERCLWLSLSTGDGPQASLCDFHAGRDVWVGWHQGKKQTRLCVPGSRAVCAVLEIQGTWGNLFVFHSVHWQAAGLLWWVLLLHSVIGGGFSGLVQPGEEKAERGP